MPTHSRKTILLATDQQRSVLNALDSNQPRLIAYTPYGHRPPENGLLSLLGFNGELPDPLTGHYHLGKGYRQFNPVLMRFNSPDSWSPFGEGGLNAYGYCGGDSINRSDPSGHFWGIGKFFRRIFRRGPKLAKNTNPASKTVAHSSADVLQPPPLSSQKIVTDLTLEDYVTDDLNYDFFSPKNEVHSIQRPKALTKRPLTSPHNTEAVNRSYAAQPKYTQRYSVEALVSQKSKELQPTFSTLSTKRLFSELELVQSRLVMPGPSSNILVEQAMQKEIIRRMN